MIGGSGLDLFLILVAFYIIRVDARDNLREGRTTHAVVGYVVAAVFLAYAAFDIGRRSVF